MAVFIPANYQTPTQTSSDFLQCPAFYASAPLHILTKIILHCPFLLHNAHLLQDPA